jgi:hypothetical protein
VECFPVLFYKPLVMKKARPSPPSIERLPEPIDIDQLVQATNKSRRQIIDALRIAEHQGLVFSRIDHATGRLIYFRADALMTAAQEK